MINPMKKVKLQDLECIDDMYHVGHLIDIDGSPWVTKGEAEEILEIVNALADAVIDSAFRVE